MNYYILKSKLELTLKYLDSYKLPVGFKQGDLLKAKCIIEELKNDLKKEREEEHGHSC
jgi:hypothetical protein